jgi:iron complex transport system permease protein
VETEIAAKTASGSSTRVYLPILAFLLVVLAGVLVLSMGMGATKIGAREVLALLTRHGSGSTDSVILFEIRLPRVLASVLVGAALSVAGLLFQGLFRNPMADPYVIGSSGGAALGAGIGLFLLPRFLFSDSGRRRQWRLLVLSRP